MSSELELPNVVPEPYEGLRSLMRKIFPTILVLSLLGLIISILMIRIHYRISVDPDKKSFCHLSQKIDCDAVLASPPAKVGPFFKAELNFSYYLFLILGLLCIWKEKKRLPFLSFLFFLAFFFSVCSLVLDSISIAKLHIICPLGLINIFISLTILALLPSVMKIPLREMPRTLKKKLIYAPKSLLTYLFFVLVVFGIGLAFSRKLNPQAQYSFGFSPESYLKNFYGLPQQEILLPERPIRGNPNASVTILVFSDFSSGACQRAASALKPILEQYGDRVRQVYLNYPLNSSCNSAVQRTRFPTACLSSKAALCASQQGKFWEYHDRVIQHPTIDYKSVAVELGMDRLSFENCMGSEKTNELLQEDIATAIQFKVSRVPTIYINGRLFLDWSNAERLRSVLESELEQSAK